MKKFKVNFDYQLISFLLFLFLIFAFLFFVLNYGQRNFKYHKFIPADSEAGETISPPFPSKSDSGERISAIGVIRTTGLSSEQKQALGLSYANYQIISLKKNNLKTPQYKYFLEGNDLFSSNYLGKCVKVEGRILPGWDDIEGDNQKNNQYTYGNLAITPENLSPVDMSECDPYSEVHGSEKYFETATFSGVLKHGVRPAPDIGYDYILTLDEEYLDEKSALGYPTYLTLIDVSPFNNAVWMDFEENIGRRVTLEGYYVWGLAESKYLETHSIK